MFAAMMILVLLLCGVGLGDSFAMVSSTVQRGTGASNIFKLHPSDRKALDDSFGALFKNVGGEKFGEVHASTGQIPKDIQGTYFRNGSGKWQVAPGEEYQSPFDGDGHILAVSFSEGRAFTRNKLVRTQGFMEELRENKVCYRGFGVKPGGWLANAFDLRAKNVANTSIVFWAGKLLALWEAGAPHELDPLTLETIGLSDINGQLQGAEKEFSAHPRVDRKRNRLVGFGSSIRENKLRIYEFGPTFDLVEPVREEDLGQGFHMLHDFGLTDRYCIFLDVSSLDSRLRVLLLHHLTIICSLRLISTTCVSC
jgi:carotenoid cleavage dioxygenase-like enzyme